MSDEEINRMFPDPQSAARARVVGNRLEKKYEDWKRRQPAAVSPSADVVALKFAPACLEVLLAAYAAAEKVDISESAIRLAFAQKNEK